MYYRHNSLLNPWVNKTSSRLSHKLKPSYVFTDASGLPVDPNLATRAFKKLVAAAGLPKLTIHGLRHTHATILLEQGVNPKVVSERLGHASVATTMDIYSHVLPDMQEKAALAIDAALSAR